MASMRQPIRLTSNDNPRAKAVVALRQQRERRTTGLFVAEGVREVSRSLACGLVMRELYFHSETLGVQYDGLTGVIPALEKVAWAFEGGKGATLFEVGAGVLAKMSYCERPEGIVAVFEQPRWTPESLLGKGASAKAPLWLIAVGTTKPGNLGAMARSLAAAGGQGIITSDAAVDPFNPNALRASTGAVLSLPIVSMPGEDVREFCSEHGVTIAVTSPRAKTDYSSLDLTRGIAFAIGAEDTGLDASWLTGSKKKEGLVEVSIPMARGVVDSLNASNAAAVLLFEAVRQRRK